jgi:hypothetical protein
MKNGIATLMILASFAGCIPAQTAQFASNSPVIDSVDAQNLRLIRDLGLTPEELVAIARAERERRQAAAVAVASSAIPAHQCGNCSAASRTATTQRQVVALDQHHAPVVVTSKAPTTIVVSTPAIHDVSIFHSALAPYGSWINLPRHGLVWQPTATVMHRSWRPYCDGGRWVWTDHGWYWKSSYSWGWAAFHYGRWLRTEHHRWVWIPDVTWGPAWVSWRYSSHHAGWAPLTPKARYRVGIGLVFSGSDVGIDFRMGLSDNHYVFVPTAQFLAIDLSCAAVPAAHSPRIYRQSTVLRRCYATRNSRVINSGVPTHMITRATGRNVTTSRVLPRHIEASRNLRRSSPTHTSVRRSTGQRTQSMTHVVERHASPAPVANQQHHSPSSQAPRATQPAPAANTATRRTSTTSYAGGRSAAIRQLLQRHTTTPSKPAAQNRQASAPSATATRSSTPTVSSNAGSGSSQRSTKTTSGSGRRSSRLLDIMRNR